MRYYLSLIVTLVSLKAWSSGPLSFDSTWEKLLFLHSPSKDENFYLSKRPIDPQKELRALIASLEQPQMVFGALNEHPVCSFPMRKKWLERQLGISAKISCPTLTEWKKSIAAKSISIVFSSAYVDNPSSMFGHTLIKFNKYPINIPHLNSLNYVGAYSAAVDTEDPGFLYAIKGILGGYLGSFSLSPYYMKLREYVRAESRELWEYELTLSEQELDDLLDLYWEVYVAGKFNYYFLDENCSMLLARLLDIIMPEMKLAEDYKLFVVPSEFIKKLSASKRLKSIEVTPSYRRTFFGHYALLSDDQKKEFKTALNNHELENLEPLVVRTLSQYYAYKKNDSEGKVDDKHKKQEFEVRKKLSTISLDSLPPPNPQRPENRPDIAHDQWHLGIGTYRQDNQTGLYTKTRFGFHDLYDYDIGNEPISDIRLLDSQINFTEDEIKVKYLGLVEMTSLPDYSYLDSRTSWKVRTAFVRNDEDKLSPYAEFSLGLSFRNQRNNALIGLMIGGESYFNHHNPLLNIPIILKSKWLSFGLESTPYYDTKNHNWALREKLTLRKHFMKNFSAELESEIHLKTKTNYNVQLGIRTYF